MSLAEVLFPNGKPTEDLPDYCRFLVRKVKPFTPRTEAEQALLDNAAQRVRFIYLASQRRLSSTEDRDPTPFMEACADTLVAAYELGNAIEDDALLSVAWGVLKHAGVIGSEVKPTTLHGQVQMQVAAVDAAKTLLPLFARQQALELWGEE